ncbi:hypothetical protein D3C73_1107820 [compost metagenome]
MTIVEADVIADLEADLRVGKIIPARGDLRDDLALVITGDEIVEDVAVDVVAVRIPLNMRVERRRLARQINDKKILRGVSL